MADIKELQTQLDKTNQERAEREQQLRREAIDIRRQRDELYARAIAARDAIGKSAIDNATGEIVRVYDPKDLDKETLAILKHMGTPVPPVDEVYPDGVTLAGKQKGR